MKFEVKKVFVFLPLIAALTACGGGGSDGGTASVDTSVGSGGTPTGGTTGGTTGGSTGGTTGGNTGTTTTTPPTAFVKGTAARYQFVGVAQQASGRLDTFEQTTDGGVVTLNAQTLTGATRAVADIAGDETFAIGRWSKGTATTSSGSSTIESSVNAAYHYAVYNVPAAFPATGTYKCDDGRFSSPSLVNGTSSVYFGKGSGTAALSFSATGASVDVSITTTAGSQQGTVSATARTIASPATTAITGNYFGGGEGMSLSIGEGGTNKLRIVAAFQAKAGDSSYRGVATFNCTAQ